MIGTYYCQQEKAWVVDRIYKLYHIAKLVLDSWELGHFIIQLYKTTECKPIPKLAVSPRPGFVINFTHQLLPLIFFSVNKELMFFIFTFFDNCLVMENTLQYIYIYIYIYGLSIFTQCSILSGKLFRLIKYIDHILLKVALNFINQTIKYLGFFPLKESWM